MITTDTGHIFPARVLIDSGASGNFVDQRFCVDHDITTTRLEEPIPVRNADGTQNRGGPIEDFIDVWLEIQTEAQNSGHKERLRLEVTQLGVTYNVILGYPWLQEHNPTIDWQAGSVIFDHCAHSTNSMRATVPPEMDRAIRLETRGSLHQTSHVESDALVRTAQMSTVSSSGMPGRTPDELPLTPSLTLTDLQRQRFLRVALEDHSRVTSVEDDMHSFVPEKYWEYSDIFIKSTFDSLPAHSEFDHAINLVPDFVPQHGKKYALSPREQQELDKFLDENLSTGRI